MGLFADCITVDKVKSDNVRGKLHLSYLVLDHLDVAKSSFDSDTKLIFLPPISGIIKLNIYFYFQGTNIQVNTHSQVVSKLVTKLEKCKLFEQLGFKYQVDVFHREEAIQAVEMGSYPIITITLADKIVDGQYVEELTNSKDEQMKFNKVDFKVISTLNINIKINYICHDICQEELFQDLNYLLIVLYFHLEKKFPLIFKLTTRLIFQSTEPTSTGLITAFSKSKETEIIEKREILSGLMKSACNSLTFIDLLGSYSYKKLKRMIENKQKANDNKELLNLLWFI